MLGDSMRRRRGMEPEDEKPDEAPEQEAEEAAAPGETPGRDEGERPGPTRPLGGRSAPERTPRSRSKPGRRGGDKSGFGFTWRRWLLIALVLLVGSFATGYFLSTVVLFPPPETAGAGVPVPELYGQTRDRAEATLRTLGLEPGEVREMTSMTTEAGRVLAQDPLPGQQLLPGATVSLGVSAGPPEVRVPPLVGLGQATARELLETVGFDVAIQQTRTMEFEAGVVTRADPLPGSPQQLPREVTLIVSSGPPADSLMQDSLAQDSLTADSVRAGRLR